MPLSTAADRLIRVPYAAALLLDPIFWGRNVTRGDGHSVLYLPGYGGWGRNDLHSLPLRSWLRRIGYQPVQSGLARILSWSEETTDILCQRVEAESKKRDSRITIIGASMGGIFGWSIARRRPHAVRHLIVLGAPLASAGGSLPPQVSITSICSGDPLESPAREPHARHFKVRGTHGSLVFNREVYRILAAVLAKADAEKV
jgi:pimeloyl-ACP methyl ester carboxylesterase